jgi:7-keto-8-aminopelargonate synthetase-like enzyme
MPKAKSFFSRTRKVQTVNRLVSELQREGIIKHRAGSGDGSEWTVDGRSLRNFGSCSYMGLERHPALLAGAEEALYTYGANFSISRIFLECPLYEQLEATLSRAMGRPVLVAQSTSNAHLAALPVLVGERDLVLVDQFAHSSVHMATDLIDDAQIELVRHNRMDLLEQRLNEAEAEFERVWYLCDGIYSMLGDFAPYAELRTLLARYPKLHLYVDDAHAMSWLGEHGRGSALTYLGDSERLVVAVSLSKAFGAAGGALALPSVELRDRIRNCGGPLMFSGPGAGLGRAPPEPRVRDHAGRAGRAHGVRTRGARATRHRDRHRRRDTDLHDPLRLGELCGRRGADAARTRLLLLSEHVSGRADEQAQHSLHGQPPQSHPGHRGAGRRAGLGERAVRRRAGRGHAAQRAAGYCWLAAPSVPSSSTSTELVLWRRSISWRSSG